MTKKEELEAQGYKTYENDDIQVLMFLTRSNARG
jgi:hypothetical protein